MYVKLMIRDINRNNVNKSYKYDFYSDNELVKNIVVY